ncbi:pimeloyl-ACP methyl ester carboxylesterase [Kribbella sp. VKM Ac-2527]|uniref:Pimeloyl-ACP methyl ester carboxylesterase n=1 Tax=Kribbella caucasensis TaxID=2512215 RepID=A0A4V6PT15_9ACTN|nr:alpha/beta hydrolase [Kribbella sp. VKM Ac-2527]TDO44631.1 pimeloyl-ACP methyl ester carboxylesterase [Kribbella sp. VKM Ac-2527]
MIAEVVRAGLKLLPPRVAGRVAFELWRRPLKRGRVRESERAIHESARVEVIGNVVTYAWGDGRRPVLLVHGWRSRASRYHAFVARLLALGYSPVSYDAPGHGDTPGPAGTILDHQRIIQALGDRHGPFEGVIAHSLGVPFALYAVREGVSAGRIVAISGVAEFGYLVDAFCRELGLGAEANQALRRAIEAGLFQRDDQIWAKYSVAAGEVDLLVIHNDEDDVVDPAQASALLAGYGPRAHFKQTNGLGHRRIMVDPAVITEAVTFLSHTEDARDSDVAERLDLGA